jgi:hypothetical protein
MAFALAIASESAVAVPLLAPSRASRWRRSAAVCLAQLATHPAVWFIWPLLGLSRPAYVLCAESFAFVLEALIYRFVFERLTWSRALATSALANGVSLALGLLLH